MCELNRFSYVWLLVTLWTEVPRAPLSMGFSRQEHWSRLPGPPPGDLPTPGIEPISPALILLFILRKIMIFKNLFTGWITICDQSWTNRTLTYVADFTVFDSFLAFPTATQVPLGPHWNEVRTTCWVPWRHHFIQFPTPFSPSRCFSVDWCSRVRPADIHPLWHFHSEPSQYWSWRKTCSYPNMICLFIEKGILRELLPSPSNSWNVSRHKLSHDQDNPLWDSINVFFICQNENSFNVSDCEVIHVYCRKFRGRKYRLNYNDENTSPRESHNLNFGI